MVKKWLPFSFGPFENRTNRSGFQKLARPFFIKNSFNDRFLIKWSRLVDHLKTELFVRFSNGKNKMTAVLFWTI